MDPAPAPSETRAGVTPYVLASATRDYIAPLPVDQCERLSCRFPLGAYAGEVALGAEANVRTGSGAALDLALSPDFSQVEPDDEQLNLTRFNQFFPEKRPLFLDTAGTFSVGGDAVGGGRAIELFYSRRIGLGVTGEPVPILGGGQVRANALGLVLGVMDVQTSAGPEGEPADNYAVARVIRPLANGGRVGALFVNRSVTDSGGGYNRTYAVDGRLRLASGLWFDGLAAQTATPNYGTHNQAVSLRATYDAQRWSMAADYAVVDQDFNPEVGFLERTGYRSVLVQGQRSLPLGDGAPGLEIRPQASYQSYWGLDGFNQSRKVHLGAPLRFKPGVVVDPGLNLTREGLEAPFPISPGVEVATGRYDNVEAAWRWSTDPNAAVWAEGGFDWGGFLSGTRRGAFNTLNLRMGSRFTSSLRLSYNALALAEGRFSTRLTGLRLAYRPAPGVVLQSLTQYNSLQQSWSGNLRFGWLDAVGNGLWLVYSVAKRGDGVVGPFTERRRAVSLKFTRQLTLTR